MTTTIATLNVETPPKVQKFAMSGGADDVLTIEPKVTADPNADGSELARYKGAVQLVSATAWSFAKDPSSAALMSIAAGVPFTLVITGKTTIYISGAGADDLIVTTVR